MWDLWWTKWHEGQVFFEYLDFHRLLHTHHLSSGVVTIDQLVAKIFDAWRFTCAFMAQCGTFTLSLPPVGKSAQIIPNEQKFGNKCNGQTTTAGNMRTIRKVTSGELLTKQAARSKILMQKVPTYLSYFSMQSPPELRHLSYRRISFCMPVTKKSAGVELSHVLTPPINSSLLLKRCDPSQFFR
jgi:hypothetical protein